jgi:plasmid stabilization system protein ParE
MKNYRLSQLAQKDIEEIIDYLEQISLKVVNIFIESTYATFATRHG